MKNNNFKKITISIAATCIFIPAFAFAQTGETPTTRQAARTEKVAEVCAKVTSRVDERIAHFNKTHASASPRYDSVIERLKSVSEKLKSKNLDTVALDAAIVTLEAKAAKIDTDKDAFIAKLTESKSYACGSAEGKYKEIITEAQALQKVVVADIKDTKDYFNNTVKPILEGIKTSAKKASN
jgi:hypothetical protein